MRPKLTRLTMLRACRAGVAFEKYVGRHASESRDVGPVELRSQAVRLSQALRQKHRFCSAAPAEVVKVGSDSARARAPAHVRARERRGCVSFVNFGCAGTGAEEGREAKRGGWCCIRHSQSQERGCRTARNAERVPREEPLSAGWRASERLKRECRHDQRHGIYSRDGRRGAVSRGAVSRGAVSRGGRTVASLPRTERRSRY